MNSLSRIILSSTLLAVSGGAYALVNVDAGVGQRTNSFKYDTPMEDGKTMKIKGSEYFANVAFDPIPLVPVSMGLAFQGYSYDRSSADKDVFDDTFKKAGVSNSVDSTITAKTAGLLYGPSLKVWAPIPFVKPYLRYTYLVGIEKTAIDYYYKSNSKSSSVFGSTALGSTTSQHTGSDIQVGVGFSPIRFVSMFVEYAIHTGKSKITDQSIDQVSTVGTKSTSKSYTKSDLTDDQKASETTNATSIRVGISAGI